MNRWFAKAAKRAGRRVCGAASAAVEALERRICLAVTVTDVTLAEGTGGTRNFNFTVTYVGSIPMGEIFGAEAVTADGTASVADGDYQAKQESFFFTSGQRTRTFSVVVNSDSKFEPDEAFFVDVTEDFGPGDRGTGTILNDDVDTSRVTVAGSVGDDVIVLTASSSDDVSYSVNNSPPVALVDVRSLTVEGLGGNDLVRLVNPGGFLFIPVEGINYNGGGQGGDSLEIIGGTSPGGTYTVGPTADAGVVTRTQVGTLGGTQTVRFTGLASLLDTVAEPTFTVNATDGANSITIDNGGVTGDGRLRVGIDSFEPVEFANKGILRVNGGVTAADVGDTFTVAPGEAAAALTDVLLFGGEGADTFNVRGTAAGTSTGVNGEGGDDNVIVNSQAAGPGLAMGNLDGIAGTLAINLGSGAANAIRVSDYGGTTANANVTVQSGGITGLAGPSDTGSIVYSGALQSLTVDGSNTSNDVITMIGVPAGASARVFGHGGSDTLIGPGIALVWSISTNNAGTFFGLAADFQSIENLVGGASNDRFILNNDAGVLGTIDGGGAFDTLEYRNHTTAVAANLGLGTTGLSATLSGDQEVPARPTAAGGSASVSNYNHLTKAFDITVTVNGIPPAQVQGLNIQRAPVGVNGPIIIDFMPGGAPIAPLVPIDGGTGFTFTATGVSLASSMLGGVANEAAFLGGITYVNVHTPASPDGEIRGQLFSTGNVSLASGTATGTGGVSNVEGVTASGVGTNNSLVGSFATNNLRGGFANDTMVGGPGFDSFFGEGGDDVMAWNSGDGSDNLSDAGGASLDDVVQINAAVSLNDVFFIGAVGPQSVRVQIGGSQVDIGSLENITVNGIAGDDTFTVNNLSTLTKATQINLHGYDGSDRFNFAATSPGSATFSVHGGGGSDTLSGPDTGATFNITDTDRGNVAGLVDEFQFVENLGGGLGNDTFAFGNGDAITGMIDAGAGTDSLDYAAYTSAIAVNLGANAPGLTAALAGDQELPPRGGSAAGAATLTYDNVARTFNISLTVDGINPAQVNGFHIQRAALGLNGPVIVDFGGNAGLVPTGGGTGFTFTANNVPLSPLHEAALLGGLAYVDVKTQNFPGGAIRGQIFPSGLFVAAPASAPGAAAIASFENATGGSGSFTVGSATFGDSIVGNNGANILQGGDGNDVLVGARGNDVVSGDAGDDAIVWSNGDGTDVMDGNAGSDLVQVHGAPAADDTFTLAPGPGGRIDVDRPAPAPFSLDIGGTEELTVAGLSGDDKFTADSLGGVLDLTFLRLAGLEGSDSFAVTPAATVTIDVSGHSPTPPSQPGDTLNVNPAGTTNAGANFIHTSAGYQGTYTFGNRRPVNFKQIETGPTAPRVVSASFNNNTAPHTLEYGFSEDISGTFGVGDLRLENLTTGAVLDASQTGMVQDPFTRTAIFTFPGYPRGILPDGRWRATLLAPGIRNTLGTPLDGDADLNPGGDHVFSFLHFTGDANGDGAVGFPDLVRLAQNYGGINKTYGDGDFDYDTDVDFADLVLLAQRYNTSLPAAGAMVAGADEVTADARAGRSSVFNAAVPVRPPARRPAPRKTR